MNIGVLGIDIAKNRFQPHDVDHAGKMMLKKRLARAKLTADIANIPICTIVMEACAGAKDWARTFMQLGHKVKLISPQFVKPFVKTKKTMPMMRRQSWMLLVDRQCTLSR